LIRAWVPRLVEAGIDTARLDVELLVARSLEIDRSRLFIDDPELTSDVLGATTASDQPATEGGVDRSAGDEADAVTDGGSSPPADFEPDLRDAAAGPRQVDRESAS